MTINGVLHSLALDRATKNLKYGYNFDESWKFSEVKILRGTASTATVKSGAIFQARINLLSMHAMMLYSETMRYVELSDLCILRLEHEHCLIVFQKITHSKTIRSVILSTRDFRISLGRHSNHMG